MGTFTYFVIRRHTQTYAPERLLIQGLDVRRCTSSFHIVDGGGLRVGPPCYLDTSVYIARNCVREASTEGLLSAFKINDSASSRPFSRLAIMDGIAVGLNKGHPVTKKAGTPRPSRRKGFLSQRVKKVRLALIVSAHVVSTIVHISVACMP